MTDRITIRSLLSTRDSTASYNYCERNYSEVRTEYFNALYELRKHDPALVADVEREIKAEKVKVLCGNIRSSKLRGLACVGDRKRLSELLADLGHSRMGARLRGAA